MQFEYHQFTYGSDNYGVLIHDKNTSETACVDAGDSKAYLAALKETGWSLTQIWITHHHLDHTHGLAKIKEETGAVVYGPSAFPGVDKTLEHSEIFLFSGAEVHVISTPGHTLDMLNFYIKSEETIFTGDTLFVMGCGRLFEGTPEQMYESLVRLMELPDQTLIYCSHEYTLASTNFALSVDFLNKELIKRHNIIANIVSKGEPTVPTTMGKELKTNPFLRFSDNNIREHLGMLKASNVEVFTKLRELKDSF